MRVPTATGSITDLVVELEKNATVDEINAKFKEAAEGYEVKNIGDEGETILTNGSLRVGIFPQSFPHKLWCGHILVEHEANFDKWSKHFYRCNIPGDLEIDILIADLKYIDNDQNRIAGDRFSTLVRTI